MPLSENGVFSQLPPTTSLLLRLSEFWRKAMAWSVRWCYSPQLNYGTAVNSDPKMESPKINQSLMTWAPVETQMFFVFM